MSAEIPGAKPEFKVSTIPVTDLVTKILIVTGERPDTSHIYGAKIGGYAGEILLTALNNAGLLSSDFSPERLGEAVQALDTEMDLDQWVADTVAKRE